MTEETQKSGCRKVLLILSAVLGGIVVLFAGCVGMIAYNYNSLESESKGDNDIADTSWVPKGFQPFNNKVAIKWSDKGTYECSYGQSCIQMEVIPKEGCSSLYAELTKHDKAGNNVGYTNKMTSSVAAGQKAILLFETFGEFESFQLSRISCH